MRVVLHIGAAKTATTYIQHALYTNTDVLARHGVYLPKAGRSEFGNHTVVHHHLGWELLEDPRFTAEAGGWEALGEELSAVDAETVVISSESLERMTYAADRRARLEEQLRKLPGDVTVVYAVRDQLSSLNSLYTQSIKSFRTAQNFKPFVRRVVESGNFDLNRCLQSWYHNDALTLVAVPFEKLVAEDPLLGFLAAAGVEVPAGELSLSKVPSNVSSGPVAVVAAKLLGRSLVAVDPAFAPKSNRGRRLYRLAAAMARQNGWCEEKYWGWGAAFAAQTAERFAESNRAFAEAVWGPRASIVMPLGRPPSAVTLLDLEPTVFAEVQSYVDGLVRHYLEVSTGRRYPGSVSDTAATDATAALDGEGDA